MHEADGLAARPGGLAQQLLWVLHQPRRRGYRARSKSAAAHREQNGLDLGRLEQNPDYQRLLARLLRLSEGLQPSLTTEQRRTWLMLEDALLDHAWFLHAYYFEAGYQLGKTATRRRPAADGPSGSAVNQSREQALLLSAFAKLLERLVAVGRPRD